MAHSETAGRGTARTPLVEEAYWTGAQLAIQEGQERVQVLENTVRTNLKEEKGQGRGVRALHECGQSTGQSKVSARMKCGSLMKKRMQTLIAS